MATVRTLIVLRHAKSAWPPGVPDDERPLSARGRRDANQAGLWLSEQFGEVDLAMVSPAARTQQTWERLAKRLNCDDVRTEEAVYLAGASRLLNLVQGIDKGVRTALLVGHNPGCEDLAADLAGSVSGDAGRRMAVKYPTAGIAVLTSDSPWRHWTSRSAKLADFYVARADA